MKCHDIQQVVKSYLDGKDKSNNKQTKFKNEKDWITFFLKKLLLLRFGNNFKGVRAAVSRPVLNAYFKNLI